MVDRNQKSNALPPGSRASCRVWRPGGETATRDRFPSCALPRGRIESAPCAKHDYLGAPDPRGACHHFRGCPEPHPPRHTDARRRRSGSCQDRSRENHLRGRACHPLNGIDPFHGFLERGHYSVDLLVKANNALVEAVDLAQEFPKYKAVHIPHSSRQCLLQNHSLVSKATLREFGHHLGVRLSGNQSRQYRPSRRPAHC